MQCCVAGRKGPRAGQRCLRPAPGGFPDPPRWWPGALSGLGDGETATSSGLMGKNRTRGQSRWARAFRGPGRTSCGCAGCTRVLARLCVWPGPPVSCNTCAHAQNMFRALQAGQPWARLSPFSELLSDWGFRWARLWEDHRGPGAQGRQPAWS